MTTWFARAAVAAGLTRHPNVTNPWAWRLLLLLGSECPDAPDETPVEGVECVHADVVAHQRSVPRGWYDAVTAGYAGFTLLWTWIVAVFVAALFTR